MSIPSALDLLIRAVDQAYDHTSWHGPNLRGSMRGVTPELAIWRMAPGRRNIAEQVLHAAYWKYVVTRLLTGEKRGGFPLAGTNWFSREAPYSMREWKADLALSDETHARWREVVAGIEPARLGAIAKGKFSVADVIQGVAAHDLYHAGQINVTRRAWDEAVGASE